ncbi:sigma 54 modulation protein/ribosomal protein S30EA [Sulfobacillus acidophilus TPY]|uniref:Ribosome hibernation promoting factor n=1 Tax=Sulfobacillus acidophilus (strain ATCC 700253 / DSM 10332 / NAL) TaxID=679936 RepID=G8TYL8_SULAD|nr:sigma 54 modulation protein/ribosomal protein S30EA [Sulfobacillus acidophilus TPY]AEW06279.1 SSU ribosomal protein S30P [Sulfobacillus acidophilus DSM 10332]
MDVIVRGKNVEVTDALKDHVTRKLSKMSKYFDHQEVTAQARLSVEKDRHIVEVTVPVGGYLLRGEEAHPDMYVAVDRVVDKLERQLDKYKTRLKPRHLNDTKGVLEDSGEEGDSALVRRKTFPRKPMTVDEAMMQMELLGHDFFAFTNAETDTINVLYRRQDGNYGLLEPR